jgi:hypothetical protein
VTLSDMSDSCLLQSFNSNSTFIMDSYVYEMEVDYLVVEEILNVEVV